MVELECRPEIVCVTIWNYIHTTYTTGLQHIRVKGHFTIETKELLLSLLSSRVNILRAEVFVSGVEDENRIELTIDGKTYNG